MNSKPLLSDTEYGKYWSSKNELPASNYTSGSGKRGLWECVQCSHEWEAVIGNVTKGHLCPVCGRAKAAKSRRLANMKKNPLPPQLYAELVNKEALSAHSVEKVEWECSQGHRWFATPHHRTNGTGCPTCANASRAVKAAKQGKKIPESIAPQIVDKTDLTVSRKRPVLWRCDEGHEWKSTIDSRLRGTGCWYCNNYPQVAHETNPLSPQLQAQLVNKDVPVSAQSIREVEWECSYGHRWVATAAARTGGAGCPECKNIEFKIPDELRAEAVNPESLEGLRRGSRALIDWRCESGHVWQAAVKQRARVDKPSGCPRCRLESLSSRGEREMADFVESLGYEIIRNDRVQIKPMELDVYIPAPRIAIEFNGTYWHSLPKAKERDAKKAVLCKEQGINLLTIWEHDWERQGCKEFIAKWIRERLT